MAQNDDGGDDPIDAMFRIMETLSLEQKEKCTGRMVALFGTDEKVDTSKVAKNSTKCIRLQKERNKLQKDLEEAGEDTQKKLRSIADDLDWHCRNTSALQGVGDGATVLGSAMVLAGLGSSLFGYNEIGERLANAGKTVYNVGFCTSGSAHLCQIGIEYWSKYDIQETIITPYEEKCTILTEKNKELKAVITELNINITKYPILSKILSAIGIPSLSLYKVAGLGAKSVHQHMPKKSSMPKSKQSLNDEGSNTESGTSSGKRESVMNNKASILKTSSSCEKNIDPFSKWEYLELSVTSAISIPLSCYNLYNLKQKFHTGKFSEAAIELREKADLIEQRTVSFTL